LETIYKQGSGNLSDYPFWIQEGMNEVQICLETGWTLFELRNHPSWFIQLLDLTLTARNAASG